MKLKRSLIISIALTLLLLTSFTAYQIVGFKDTNSALTSMKTAVPKANDGYFRDTYTVTRPVRETQTKDISYTVTRPVREQRSKTVTYTQMTLVREQQTKIDPMTGKEIRYTVEKRVPEQREKVIDYAVTTMVTEPQQKTIAYQTLRFETIELPRK